MKKSKPCEIGIYICEIEFEQEDQQNKGYSRAEVDIYAWIPPQPDMKNHRLTLRKNLKTGEYEVIRVFQEAYYAQRRGMALLSNTPTNEPVEVAFHSKDLQKAIDFENAEYDKYHSTSGDTVHVDKICTHEYPARGFFCQAGKRGKNSD